MTQNDTNTDTRGIFISFEGGEGAGKTTHIRFLAQSLEARGYEVVCLREPGGTAIGEALREVVLDPAHAEMSPEAELLIYEAARAQIVAQVIRPALERGAVVLCDRFFDSTIAYQAYGRGLSLDFVQKANLFATGGLVPDRTILLTCNSSAETGLERATHHTGADRLEQAGLDFHTRVNEAFVELAKENPERIRVVVSDALKSVTSAMVFHQLSDLFAWMADASICSEEFFAPLDLPREHGSSESGSGKRAPHEHGSSESDSGKSGESALCEHDSRDSHDPHDPHDPCDPCEHD